MKRALLLLVLLAVCAAAVNVTENVVVNVNVSPSNVFVEEQTSSYLPSAGANESVSVIERVHVIEVVESPMIKREITPVQNNTKINETENITELAREMDDEVNLSAWIENGTEVLPELVPEVAPEPVIPSVEVPSVETPTSFGPVQEQDSELVRVPEVIAPVILPSQINETHNVTGRINFKALVRDAKGNVLDAQIVVKDRLGAVVAEELIGARTVAQELTVPTGPVDVEIEFAQGPITRVTLDEANLSESQGFVRVDDVPEPIGWVSVYAIDPSQVIFEQGKLHAVAQGNALYKCKDWDFDARVCDGNWTLVQALVPGQPYVVEISSSDPAFGEIIATEAIHLDENGTVLENIYPAISAIDNVWSSLIPANHSVRVTFEKNLTNGNVIDFIGQSNGTFVDIQIYRAGTSEFVGRTGPMDLQEWRFVELSNLSSPSDTFDLRIVGLLPPVCSPDDDCLISQELPFMEFEYIHDEAATANGTAGVAVYSESGTVSPRYRNWNMTTQQWAGETTALANTGEASWVVLRSSHEFDSQFFSGVIGTDTNVSLQVGQGFNSSGGVNWTIRYNLSADVPNTGLRSLDIGVEDVSGNAVVVFETSASGDTGVALSVWNGTTLDAEQTFNISSSGGVQWIRAVSRSSTNEVMILTLNSLNDLYATLWNGSSFVNATGFTITTDTGVTTDEVFDFVWESNGNGLVVYRENSSTSIQYRTFNGGTRSWSAAGNFFTLDGGSPTEFKLCADPTSNYVGFISSDSTDDVNAVIWNGTAVETSPAAPSEIAAVEPNTAPARNVGCVWSVDGRNATFVFVDANAPTDDLISFARYNKTSWSVSSLASPERSETVTGGPSIERLEAYINPFTSEIQVLTLDAGGNDDLHSALWNRTSWVVSSGGNYFLETTVSCGGGTTQCADFVWNAFDPAPNLTLSVPQGASFNQSDIINITVNASDNYQVDKVNITIYAPNGTLLQYNLTLVQGNSTSGLYALNFTNTTFTLGRYNFSVEANDTSTHDNSNFTSGFFTIANVTSCPAVLLANTTLAQNISATGSCLSFGENNIMLDCNGFAIHYDSSGTGAASGITASDKVNVTIKNCVLIDSSLVGGESVALNLTRTNQSSLTNLTVQTNGTNDNYALFMLHSFENTLVNLTLRSNGSAGNNTVVYLINSSRNNFTQLTASANGSANNTGILVQAAHGNSFVNVALNTSGTSSYGVEIRSSENNTFQNISLRTVQWINASVSAATNFTNTAFVTGTGSLLYPGVVTMTGTHDITSTKVALTSNRTFVNSTNLSFLNVSAQVALFSINFTSPAMLYDQNDNGSFIDCTSPRCVNVSFASNVFTFNVSSFTTYAATASLQNVTFSISDMPDPVSRGGQLNYTIIVNNTGTETAFNVTVNSTYASSVVFDSSSPSAAGNITFSLGNISAGSVFMINITVNVSLSSWNGTLLNHSANVTFTNASGQATLQATSQLTLVRGTPGISTSMTDSPSPVMVGSTLRYNITVNNSGDDTAFNVSVLESYPSGVVFNNSFPSPSSGNETFTIGTLAPNQSTTINITVNVSSGVANGTTLNNSYMVTFGNASGMNSSVTNSTLTTAQATFVANVSANMSDSPDPVVRGAQLNYTITINNTGSDGVYNVSAVESYPAGVVFHSSSPSSSSGNGTFILGNLTAGTGTTVNITVNVTASNATSLNNTAAINFSNVAGLTTTISASTLTLVRGFPSMTASVNDTPDFVLVNKSVLYQVLLNNSGDDTAFNSTLVLTYPTGTIFNASAPVPVLGNTNFTVGNFSPNQTLLVNLTLNVTSAVENGTSLNLSGVLSFGNASGSNTSVVASVLTTVRGFPFIVVTHSDSPDPVFRGATLVYTVNVTNAGYDIAYNTTLVESYPSNTTFLNASPAPSIGNSTFNLGNLSINSSAVVVILLNTTTGIANATQLNNSVNVSFVNGSSESSEVNVSVLTTVIAGSAPSVVSSGPLNRTNLTISTQVFSANVTDDSSANFTCLLAIDSSTNMTNSSVQNNTLLNFSGTGLAQGNHSWNVACTDLSANTNASETRIFVVDSTSPEFNSLSLNPNSSAGLDPGAAVVFTANVSDNYTSVDTVVLHILRNGNAVQNTTMTLNASTGLFNATVNVTESAAYGAFIVANDSFGNQGTSTAVNFTVELDNNWIQPSSLGAFVATPGQNISLGTLVINNSGDYRRSFNISSTLNGTAFNESAFTINGGQLRYIQVNVSVPLSSGVLLNNLTINSSAGTSNIFVDVNGSDFSQTNVSFIIVTVDDAFLFTNFTTIPVSVTQGQSSVAIQAQVKNIGTRNASNVTLNITLPSEWTVQGGSTSASFSVLEPNDTEILNVLVAIPTTAATGYKSVFASVDGVNNSGTVLSSQNLTLNATGQVLVESAQGVFGKQGSGGSSGSGSSGSGAGGAGSSGPGGVAPGTFGKSTEHAVLVTNETIEVVRGSRIVFPLLVTNVYNNSLMKKVSLDVEGALARYVQWNPQVLETILFGRSKVFEVEVAAPLYANRSEINITFAITSELESEGIVYKAGVPFAETFKKSVIEYKTIRVVIREVSPAQAKEQFVGVEGLYEQVVAKKYPTAKADILLELLRNAMYAQNYEDAVYIAGKLKILLEKELEAGAAIEALKERIAQAKDDGLDVRETEEILALAAKAFEVEDFEKALARADEAVAIQFIELKGAFNIVRLVEKYWWMIVLIAGAASTGTYVGWRKIYVKYIAYRLELLESEQVSVQKTVKEVQEQYFVKKELGSDAFYDAMEKLVKKTESVRGAVLRLRLRRAHMLGARKALEVELKERASLQEELRKLQEDYFVKGKLSGKRYGVQSESLRLLTVEVDARIAVLRKRLKK